MISTDCARAHTEHTGAPREIAAWIPCADAPAGGQTCAPCNASTKQSTAMHIRTTTPEFEVWPLETITVLFQSDAVHTREVACLLSLTPDSNTRTAAPARSLILFRSSAASLYTLALHIRYMDRVDSMLGCEFLECGNVRVSHLIPTPQKFVRLLLQFVE